MVLNTQRKKHSFLDKASSYVRIMYKSCGVSHINVLLVHKL